MKLRFYTLWAINGPLDQERLCAQLDQMRDFGFDGAVFHPRFYPGKPAYLSDNYMAILSRTILYAKSLGMDLWIYDEDGWPSGTVGGQLLRQHPDVAQQWADLIINENPAANSLGGFERDGKQYQVVQRIGSGVDYLNPDLARHFLTMTHERYRTGLDPAAFEHVSAFFSDEPEFGLGHAYNALSPAGAIPWTPMLPELYQQRYHQDFATDLPKLFFEDPGFAIARVQFWELLTDLFCDGFITPIDNWCKQHGKRLAAHVKGEEHPLFQVSTHGSAQQVFRRLSLPGIDALERDPSNDFFPRQLASTARQFGDGRSMVECFGGAGWGAQPDEFRSYLLWLGGHGITDFIVHLWQYRLSSHAIRDWPASIPNHIGWADAFGQLLRQVKPQIIAAADRSGVNDADTLLISPHRGIMEKFEPRELLKMNVHDAGTYADTPASQINDRLMTCIATLQTGGVGYHIADERTFEEGKITDHLFQIGNCRYERIVISSDCVLSSAGAALLQQFIEVQGVVERLDIPISWSIKGPVINQLPLEPIKIQNDDTYRATFMVRADVQNLSLEFADPVDAVRINNQSVSARITERRSVVDIPNNIIVTGENVLTFTAPSAGNAIQATPFVWVTGAFRIGSPSTLARGRNGTVVLDDVFELTTPTAPIHPNLTESGYPFLQNPVTATATVSLPAGTSYLQFSGINADAARVNLDGHDLGFIWGPQWQVPLPAAGVGGSVGLILTLYLSAFNIFGPHHHMDGDPHAISPLQFEGTKNFADRPDAPATTHVKHWHVKPLSFPTRMNCGRQKITVEESLPIF